MMHLTLQQIRFAILKNKLNQLNAYNRSIKLLISAAQESNSCHPPSFPSFTLIQALHTMK